MRNSDEVYPASVKASFMYGASKSTHRVDDVVSGRITPTCRLLAPLVPAAASGLNWDIVDAMSTVKELMLSPDGTVAEPLAAGADEVAAADAGAVVAAGRARRRGRRAARSHHGDDRCHSHQAQFGQRPDVPWPCERECHPP